MRLKKYPEKILRVKCQPVHEITDSELARAREMLEFMYQSEGVGLAGPQVGWSCQIVTLDAEGAREGDRIYVNPRIVEREGESTEEEGCLSIPGLRAPVARAARLRVVAYTLDGKRVEQQVEGLLARVWQHEVDHLNGVLFIDRLDPTTLMTMRQKLKELERDAEEECREG